MPWKYIIACKFCSNYRRWNKPMRRLWFVNVWALKAVVTLTVTQKGKLKEKAKARVHHTEVEEVFQGRKSFLNYSREKAQVTKQHYVTYLYTYLKEKRSMIYFDLERCCQSLSRHRITELALAALRRYLFIEVLSKVPPFQPITEVKSCAPQLTSFSQSHRPHLDSSWTFRKCYDLIRDVCLVA